MENEAELQYLADYLARRGQTPSSPAWEGGNIMDICRVSSEDWPCVSSCFYFFTTKIQERERAAECLPLMRR